VNTHIHHITAESSSWAASGPEAAQSAQLRPCHWAARYISRVFLGGRVQVGACTSTRCLRYFP